MLISDQLKKYVEKVQQNMDAIPNERKGLLLQFSSYIATKQQQGQEANLVFICTHNSRRSHLAHVWAQVAAYCYDLKSISCYSGGTEATAFYVSGVEVLENAGLKIELKAKTANPVYELFYADDSPSIIAWSKVYSHPDNPQSHFAAIMVCSDADDNCPFIPGVEKRFRITYEDPKIADNTPQETEKYEERCLQIATEMFFIMKEASKSSI